MVCKHQKWGSHLTACPQQMDNSKCEHTHTHTHRVLTESNKLLVSEDRQRTALVFYPGRLQVLNEVEEILAGNCVGLALLGNNGLGIRRSLVVDARTL